MGNISLTTVEKSILLEGNISWANGILQNAEDIIRLCPTSKLRKAFMEECKHNIQNPENAKIGYNTEIHNFAGDSYPFVWFFKSGVVQEVIKLAVDIQLESKEVVIGLMKISTDKKEIQKCYTQIVQQEGESKDLKTATPFLMDIGENTK